MQSFEEMKETIRKLAKRIGFPMDETKLYILPLPGLLCGAEMDHQKFLIREAVELTDDKDGLSIAAALSALAAKGLTKKKVTLLVNAPSCRLVTKKFPDMTEEELEESLYWEEDRIFYTDEPRALGHRVLSHSPEGYETLLAAWPRKELEPWLAGAKQAGRILEAACPVMDISLKETAFFALYAKKDSAILSFHKGEQVFTKKMTLDEENGAFFMQSMMAQHQEDRVPCYVIPMADCTAEQWENWQQWMNWEMQKVNVGEVEAVDDIEETGEGRLYWAEAYGDGRQQSLWNRIMPLFMRGDTCQIYFPLSHERTIPFFSKENQTLRLLQGLLVVAILFFAGAAIRYGWYGAEEMKLRKEALAWQPVKEQWLAQKQEAKKEQELLDFLKQLEKEAPHWEQKLVLLADGLPQGVVLSEIKTEGGKVQITGTAVSSSALRSFENQLKMAWGGDLRLAKRKNNSVTKLVEFRVEWKTNSEE